MMNEARHFPAGAKCYLVIVVGVAVVSVSTLSGNTERGAITFELRPVDAEGPHTFDGNEIILEGGGQRVRLELMISDWAPQTLGAYQGTLDCSTFLFDMQGALLAVPEECHDPGADPNFCWQNDSTRPDHVFAGETFTAACDTSNLCPDGSPGAFRCGSDATITGGVTDPGVERYGATMIVAVSANANGTATLGLSADPDQTFALNGNGTATLSPINRITALITVHATGACCDGTSGICVDDVPESTCPVDPGDPENQYRWEKGTLCADLEPPCDPCVTGTNPADRPNPDQQYLLKGTCTAGSPGNAGGRCLSDSNCDNDPPCMVGEADCLNRCNFQQTYVVECNVTTDCTTALGMLPATRADCVEDSRSSLFGYCVAQRNRFLAVDPGPNDATVATARRVCLDDDMDGVC